MPCPHHRSTDDEDHGIERRSFMKTAVAIGGTSALAAAKARAHGDGGDDGDGHGEPAPGTDDPGSLPNRQYAWNDYMPKSDITGLAKTPKHHLQLMLDYTGDGTPTDAEREQVEAALQTLERAYEWSNEGLLFTLGYSPAYFDRFDEDLPDETGLQRPQEVIDESDISRSGTIDADTYDAHLHMASDTAIAVIEAEAALLGEVEEANGVTVDDTLEGVFERTERRTGFIGNPKERWDEDLQGKNPVEEDASVWFGFKSLFTDSQPSEDHVAIDDESHPFHDATTEQVSLLLDSNLQEWYGQNDIDERIAKMFSPDHDVENTGRFGRQLGPTSGTDEKTMDEIAAETKADAESDGVVGHAQKLARARKGEDNTPPLLRRDFPSTDGDRAHTQFISNQRTIQDFIDVRRAMAFVNHEDEDADAESELPIKDHGIQGHFQVQSRGTFLVPSRELRALPPASP